MHKTPKTQPTIDGVMDPALGHIQARQVQTSSKADV